MAKCTLLKKEIIEHEGKTLHCVKAIADFDDDKVSWLSLLKQGYGIMFGSDYEEDNVEVNKK